MLAEATILSTDRNTGLTQSEVESRLDLFGYNELPEKKTNACLAFLSYFWGPMPCMIWVAMILEVVQSINVPSHWTDFGVLAGKGADSSYLNFAYNSLCPISLLFAYGRCRLNF